jgi:membrane associated rhomboid family serine protease
MSGNGLRYQFNVLGVVEKLIVFNVLVFIISGLLKALTNFFLEDWLSLPKDLHTFFLHPWSLVTYSFLHSGLFHILFNMLWLYFAGRILVNLFGAKKFLWVYFLGVVFGGLLFLISYNVFPNLIRQNTYLVGASAGVLAVLIFVCTYLPHKEIRFFFFNLKLWHLGVGVVLLDLIQIQSNENIGGHLAHLGGAFLGYLFARQLQKGNDLTKGFEQYAAYFKPKRKSPLKTVYKKNDSAKSDEAYKQQAHQKKIDAILDKISKSGYESLSKAEKDFLFNAGKEK